MAKDSKGRKFNRIASYQKTLSSGEVITVRAHVRSNRKDSAGSKGKKRLEKFSLFLFIHSTCFLFIGRR